MIAYNCVSVYVCVCVYECAGRCVCPVCTHSVGCSREALPSLRMMGPRGLRIFLMSALFSREKLRTRLKPDHQRASVSNPGKRNILLLLCARVCERMRASLCACVRVCVCVRMSVCVCLWVFVYLCYGMVYL